MSNFYIINKEGSAEIVEKKSKFIAHVYPVADEKEASGYLESIKKQYWDARHNCYAFVTGDYDELQRCSDDGEPSGTAGKPMLEVIHGRGLHNCLVVVTRYFGGILLGTGGLVRAYQAAAIAGIEAAQICERIEGKRIIVEADYSNLSRIQYIAAQMGIEPENTEYTDMVIITLAARSDIADELIRQITEGTAGKARFTIEENVKLYCNIGKKSQLNCTNE